MTNFDMVKEFHETFGIEVDAEPTEDIVELRWSLITEELDEVLEELKPFDWATGGWNVSGINKEKLTKELADLLYVTYGTAVSLGLPIDEAFRLVHESNMSKLEDGKVLRREDGKVLKGKNYKEPDLSVLFK